MNLDDNICYCYQVSLRKLLNFARRRQSLHASEMAECLGAGTGCGWCVPTLEKIVAAVRAGQELELLIAPAQYASDREAYRKGLASRAPTEGEPGQSAAGPPS